MLKKIPSPIALPNKSSTVSSYANLDILLISQQFTFGAILFKSCDIKKLLPYYLNQSLFSQSQDLHNYNTQQKKEYNDLWFFFFLFVGVCVFNSLFVDVFPSSELFKCYRSNYFWRIALLNLEIVDIYFVYIIDLI